MAGITDGKIAQVIGNVVDVEFPSEAIPEIYTALTIAQGTGADARTVVCEVQQHLGRNQVRAVAMSTTDGLVRGSPVRNTGAPITVPVGDACLGRVFNLLGEPVDYGAPLPAGMERRPIHQQPPKFQNLSVKTEIFETGIKVIDLIHPYAKGGKTGLFGAPASARRSSSWNSSTTSPRPTAATRCSAGSASARARATTSGSR